MYYQVRPLWVSFDSTYFVKFDEKVLIWDVLLVNNEPFLVMSRISDDIKKIGGYQEDVENINQDDLRRCGEDELDLAVKESCKKTWKNTKEIVWEIKYLWNLFTPTTVYFQKFLANYWYSWYFRFFRLYVQDVKYILKYQLPQIKRHKFQMAEDYVSKYESFETYCGYLRMGDDEIKCLDLKDFSKDLLWSKQNLLVFPDDWSLFNFYQQHKIGEILDVNSTALTRYKKFLQVKTWKIKTLLTTHWWVFQDWKALNKIFVFFPYKWYYKNQQNPRYYLPEVVKQMKFFYNVEEVYFVM